ncbi:MAG: aminodeoxychorismate/anthranilate synthase component II [Selenomonadaceae bacterium]|nr:aminodeoxychorismate/anthranilate synthase component II [Selenomonadaceae bacterium]
MILLIDNYDSFSYNLYQLTGEISPDIKVVRNDKISLEEIKKISPSKIILSPGPGRPEDAGIIIDVVKNFFDKIPILGVCLGHQAICAAFGGTITYAKKLMHGKQSEIICDENSALFKNCPKKFLVGRYHSLALNEKTLPDCLKITARTIDGEVMAVEHKNSKIFGVQFHPESILTPHGKIILENFLTKV